MQLLMLALLYPIFYFFLFYLFISSVHFLPFLFELKPVTKFCIFFYHKRTTFTSTVTAMDGKDILSVSSIYNSHLH